MSFSWAQNSWGGVVGNNPLTSAYVQNNFPTAPLTYETVSQNDAHSQLYQVPGYLMLKDLSGDKSDLIMQRGGYTGENPNKEPAKLYCYQEQASSKYYCDISSSYNAMTNSNSPSH